MPAEAMAPVTSMAHLVFPASSFGSFQVVPISRFPRLKETTGGEFRVYRASIRLLKGI